MARALVYESYRYAILGVLVAYARAQKTLSYSELVAEGHLPLNMAGNPHHRNLLAGWLFEAAKEDHEAGRPLLPALVVRANSGKPGEGFFGMLNELGRARAGETEAQAHERELAAVFDWYSSAPALIEAWVVPARDGDRQVIESRPPRFFLVPVRYPSQNPEFVVVHTDLSSEGHAGTFVTPQWWTGTWEVLSSIDYYRFLLRGNPTFWKLASWSVGAENHVHIVLAAEPRTVVAVWKARDYEDHSCAFVVLYSDGATTWSQARRQNGAINVFGPEYRRPGWPEPELGVIAAAVDSTIPG
jgi:hypothetical protein